MSDINLEYYRVFEKVAETGSVTLAARALTLSQPAVTHSIKQLEDSLGVMLFTRTSRGMKLTEEGKLLSFHVSSALNEFGLGERAIREARTLERGTINIAATELPLYSMLLPKLDAFKKRHPNITFNVSNGYTDEMISMLRQGKADIAMAVSPLHDADGLIITPLRKFNDIFVAGSEFGERFSGRRVHVSELISQPIVAMAKGTNARRHLDSWFSKLGLEFSPDYNVRTTSIAMPFIERGMAIGIIPSEFADGISASNGIFTIDTYERIPPRETVILQRKSGTSLSAQLLMESILEDCKNDTL